MKNFPILFFLLSMWASVMAIPMTNADYNTAVYRDDYSNNNPRTYPLYYYYPASRPVEDRQGEILDTAQRVVYTPIFRYKKKQAKQSKRDRYPSRKVNRIMPAYLI